VHNDYKQKDFIVIVLKNCLKALHHEQLKHQPDIFVSAIKKQWYI